MQYHFDRRSFMLGSLATAGLLTSPGAWAGKRVRHLQKTIPSTLELINPIGMGTWITFNVGRDEQLLYERTKILSAFFSLGGQLIDSSPMYGSAERVVGQALAHLTHAQNLFSATKTWTNSVQEGKRQFEDSQMLWERRQLDLVQVHNLVGWRDQLAMLSELKQQKLIRYIGVTTSHGRRHEELQKILTTQNVDFVQLTYNVLDREAESDLLPLARDKGIAVIANRPFQGGRLFNRIANSPFPEWAAELGCGNWAQFFLRFIISHPAITCAIPATSQLSHMQENMQSAFSFELPNEKQRQKMLNYLQGL